LIGWASEHALDPSDVPSPAPLNDNTEFTAPADGLDVLVWAGYASKKGAVTVTEAFLLKGKLALDGVPEWILYYPCLG